MTTQTTPTATRSADLLKLEWGNGNTDVFADMDDLAASYDGGDETSRNAREIARPYRVEAGAELDVNGVEWSEAALAAVGAAVGA